MEKIYAPWSPEQVDNLNDAQRANWFPYTCGVETCSRELIATVNGWICVLGHYTQIWAHG